MSNYLTCTFKFTEMEFCTFSFLRFEKHIFTLFELILSSKMVLAVSCCNLSFWKISINIIYGFIYILSNPSTNVYKVGMTTNSVRQRIQELGTTGVPRPFEAEKVFEIPEAKLRAVETLAHKKLKKRIFIFIIHN